MLRDGDQSNILGGNLYFAQTYFLGVVAFVDVKSSLGNPALAISSRLKNLGAEVVHSLTSTVTHVIFRNGSELTKQWARKRRVRLVSPLWVKACCTHNVRVGEAAYACREDNSICLNDSSETSQPPKQADLALPPNNLVKRVRNSLKLPSLDIPKHVHQFFQRIERRKQQGPTGVDVFSSSESSGDEENSKTEVDPARFSLDRPTHRTEIKPVVGEQPPLPLVSLKNISPSTGVLTEVQNNCPHIPLDGGPTDGGTTIPDLSVFEGTLHTARHLTPLNPLNPATKLLTPVARCNNPFIPRFKMVSNNHTLPATRKRLSPGTPLTPEALVEWVNAKKKPTVWSNVEASVTPVIHKGEAKRKRRKKVIRVVARMPSTSRRRDVNKPNKEEHSASTDDETLESDASSSKQPDYRTSEKISERTKLAQRISINTRNKGDTHKLGVACRLRKSIPVDIDASPGGADSEPVASRKTHTRTLNDKSSTKASFGIKPLTSRNSLEDFKLRRVRRACGASASSELSHQSVDHHGQRQIVIAFTGLRKDDETLLCTLVRSSPLIGYKLLSSRATAGIAHFPLDSTSMKRCTHLVTIDPFRRTVNLLRGLLSGVQIVSVDWLKNSAQQGLWLSELSYRPSGLPRSSRVRLLPNLFRKVGCIYVGHLSNPPRREIIDLLTLGGASTTNRKKVANIIIGESIPEAICVKPTWVFVYCPIVIVISCTLISKILIHHFYFVRFVVACFLTKAFCIKPANTVIHRNFRLSMKFRIRTIDTGCIEHFANIVHMVSTLTKNAIFRLNKDNLTFVIKERAVFGGVSAWCELDHAALFSERVCEGLSADQDEILLEVVLDQLMHCLRMGSGGTTSGTTFATSTSAVVGGPLTTGSVNQVGYASFGPATHQTLPTVHGLKIKLVRRKVPCLAIELEQASITGRSRAVWHFLPVHVVPPRLWNEFIEPPDPDFDVSIFFPSVKILRPFVDRMKRFAKFILISANGAGELHLGVNVETLARVRLTFRGLRARSWLPEHQSRSTQGADGDNSEEPRSAIWGGDGDDVTRGTFRDSRLELPNDIDTTASDAADQRFVSASLDIRRFAQLTSSPRIPLSCFVCNIIHDHLAQFVLLFDNCKLKFNMPAVNL
ncbi:BRCA1 protein, partial [Opisthorchis viverrini]